MTTNSFERPAPSSSFSTTLEMTLRGLGSGHMLTPLQTTSPEGQIAIKQRLAL